MTIKRRKIKYIQIVAGENMCFFLKKFTALGTKKVAATVLDDGRLPMPPDECHGITNLNRTHK